MSIMLDSNDEKRQAYLIYAQQLIAQFVQRCKDVYGDTFTAYNVHSLTHLHEDVAAFDCSLNEISSFPYENHLQIIKKLVRKSQNPVAQVSKRLTEIDKTSRAQPPDTDGTVVIWKRKKDSCFLLHNEDFAFVQEKRHDGRLVCDVIKQRHMSNFFHSPCESKLINVVYVGNLRDKAKRMLLERKDLHRKAACLPYRVGYVLFPLLHGTERQ